MKALRITIATALVVLAMASQLLGQGKLRYTLSADSATKQLNPLRASVTVTDAAVLYQAPDTWLYAAEPTEGKELWRFPQQATSDMPVYVVDSIVLVQVTGVSVPGQVKPFTGVLRLNIRNGSVIGATPFELLYNEPHAAGGLWCMFARTEGANYFVGYDPYTNVIVWKVKREASLTLEPTYLRGYVMLWEAPGAAGPVLNIRDGKPKWESGDDREQFLPAIGSSSYHIHWDASRNLFRSISPKLDKVIWKKTVKADVIDYRFTQNKLFLLLEDYTLHVIEAKEGKEVAVVEFEPELERFKLDNVVMQLGAIEGSAVYVQINKTILLKLDTKKLEVVNKLDLRFFDPVHQLVMKRGTFYLINKKDGNLQCVH